MCNGHTKNVKEKNAQASIKKVQKAQALAE